MIALGTTGCAGGRTVRHRYALSAVGLVLIASACFPGERGATIEESWQEEGLVQESWDVSFSTYEGGSARVLLEAAHMRRYEAADSVFMVLTSRAPNRVHITLFEDDTASVELTAMTVTYYEESGEMLAEGDVRLVSQDGRILETESLQWMPDDGSLMAQGFVSLKIEDAEYSGYGLTAREDLSTFRIHRVTGQFLAEDPTR